MTQSAHITRVLRQDDDAHWYLVPWPEAKRFREWLESEEKFTDYDGPDMNQYRIDSPKSLFFTGIVTDEELFVPPQTKG